MLKETDQQVRKVSSFPRDTLEQAGFVQEGWNSVGSKLVVPNLDEKQFQDKLIEAVELVERAEELKVERAKAIHERNVCLSEVWDLTKRIRNAAKATFGDNSVELQVLLNSLVDKARAETLGVESHK